ncbi:MAG: D-alanyl-D-alanine carboxypeptidase family protein [bacterium]
MILQLVVNLIITGLVWQQTLVPAGLTLADEVQAGGDAPALVRPIRILDNRSLGVKITAPYAIVLDIKSGEVLFEKNIHQPAPIASLTKLMSALIFLEDNPDFNKIITIEAEDYRLGSTIGLFSGEQVTLRDLFYSALAGSSNNAMIALARSTGLSEEKFVEKMNGRAKLLGLNNTNFIEPTGLDSGNISSAYDIVRLANYVLRNPNIRAAVTATDYSFRVSNTGRLQKVNNTNKLLKSFLRITGGKTGFTDAAGYCLASQVANGDGREILVVVLGSTSEEARFQEVKGLAWWTFENYRWE